MSNEQNSREIEEKVLQLVRVAAEQDEVLRKKHEIGDKFRFIRERLHIILQQQEQALASIVKEVDQQGKHKTLLEDEVLVYVYLYNVNGLLLASWQNFLTPKVFYEHSINRPIYIEKAHIETLIRTKSNKAQHAYLAVAIKAAHIMQPEVGVKDSLGNPVAKIKEGSLACEKLLGFFYNEQEYSLNDKGELIKKTPQ